MSFGAGCFITASISANIAQNTAHTSLPSHHFDPGRRPQAPNLASFVRESRLMSHQKQGSETPESQRVLQAAQPLHSAFDRILASLQHLSHVGIDSIVPAKIREVVVPRRVEATALVGRRGVCAAGAVAARKLERH